MATYLDLFSDTAASYAASRPRYPNALFESLAALAPGRSRAWDCGTGNGQAALGLAAFFDSVQATDASAAQLEHATAHERIAYRVAPAEASGLAAGSADLVSVAQAMHWFDLDRFYAEVRRVLRPTGILAVYGYAGFYIAPEIDPLVDRYILRPVAGEWAANNRILWDGYRTVPFPFEELQSPVLAIHLEWTLADLFAVVGTWSATRAHRKSAGDAFLRHAQEKIGEVWGEASTLRHVVMPLAVRVGRV